MPAKLFRSFLFLVLASLTALAAAAQDTLPKSSPEAEGVKAAAISDFLDAAGHGRTEFHSFIFLRHGRIVAEGWWDPYAPDLKHTLYSTSKSFTAAAIGFALAEKRLKLTDKVISFFPDDLPDTVPAFLKELTVKDALMMSDGQEPDPTPRVVVTSNWAKTFFSIPILHEPGTSFLYNSAGAYMLSAILTRVTGQTALDYLRPRLFEPLGIRGEDWETSPQGADAGGWGLRLKTEDMAKFGQLYLQGGMWQGRRILPEKWIKEATTVKIMQDPKAPAAKKDSSDWLQGYCYQMWRCRHNGVRADGAFGQFIIMLPDKDAVIAITAETPDMQSEINLVWQYLLPSMRDGPLAPDPEADAKLQAQLAALALPPLEGGSERNDAAVNGKTFALQPNSRKMQSIGFTLEDGIWQVKIKSDTAAWTFPFGDGKWAITRTTMPGPSLLTGATNHDVGLPPVKTAGSYHWIDKNTLELVLRYIESPHSEKMLCHFDGNHIKIDVTNSFEYGKPPAVIEGQLQ